MTTNILNKWWQGHRETCRCEQLDRELMMLLPGKDDTAQKLINLEKNLHPGQLESWYLDKVIYDLRRAA